jgi:hypothetical protein
MLEALKPFSIQKIDTVHPVWLLLGETWGTTPLPMDLTAVLGEPNQQP